MKPLICLIFICCSINTNISIASAIGKPMANQPGIEKASNNIKAIEFVKLSAKDFCLITGKKMNMWNRLSFSFLKMKIKHDLKKDPNLNILNYYSKKGKAHLGTLWIVLLTIVGVLLLLTLILVIALGKEQE